MGERLLFGQCGGNLCVHPDKDPQRAIDLKQFIDQLQARGIELPILIRFGDILKHRLAEIQAFRTGHRGAQLPGPLSVHLSHQGEPAAASGGGGAELRPALPFRARGRQQAGIAGGDRHGRQRSARSSATASKTTNSSRWPCWRRRSAGGSSWWWKSTPSWKPLSAMPEQIGVRPTDRHAGEAGRAGGGTVAGLGRVSLQVRPFGERDSPRCWPS